jgi:YihY family inner membrane protein
LNRTEALERVRPWWTKCKPTVHYLIETEAHVYALAISASVLLAFYPFVIVMFALCRDLLHWPDAMHIIRVALADFFGQGHTAQGHRVLGAFITDNIQSWNIPKLGVTSTFLLFFTANGVFEPMEVALNRAWGVTVNRSYLKNQIVSLGLIFACGGLALLSLALTGAPLEWITVGGWLGQFLERLVFKLAAVPISILALFLIYWLLPNRKVEPRRVLGVSIAVGLILEAGKYLNMIVSGWMQEKFHADYGVFEYSAMLLIMSALAALIVLAGAHWTADHERADPLA